MPNFNQLVIPFIILLIAINGMFLALSNVPGTQYADSNVMLFGTITNNPTINDSMNTYGDFIDGDINSMATIVDQNSTTFSTEGTDVSSLIFGALNTVTGGGLGYITNYVSFVLQLAFGYNVWIDYFFKPAYGSFVAGLGGILKGFFLLIQLYGVVYIVMSLIGRRV